MSVPTHLWRDHDAPDGGHVEAPARRQNARVRDECVALETEHVLGDQIAPIDVEVDAVLLDHEHTRPQGEHVVQLTHGERVERASSEPEHERILLAAVLDEEVFTERRLGRNLECGFRDELHRAENAKVRRHLEAAPGSIAGNIFARPTGGNATRIGCRPMR